VRRNIITTPEFDAQVEKLGGARAIDEALSPLIEALSQNPYGFELFETDGFSFRWLKTRETVWTPPFYIIFTIDPDDHNNVILQHIEELP
jgi:hypothetical protein